MDKQLESQEYLTTFLLRIGLASAFLFAGVSALLDPTNWVGFIPQFIRSLINENIFLYIHSTGELILGLWLLSNKKIFYAASISALSMFAILVFNLSELDIIFRDIAIFFMALALAIAVYQKK